MLRVLQPHLFPESTNFVFSVWSPTFWSQMLPQCRQQHLNQLDFFIEIKGMGCLCRCALPTINYFSTPSFWIFLTCPWEKPRKLQFYIALFYCLLVFSLNDRRCSVPNDESLGLENLVFLGSSPTLTRSWICPGLLLGYLPLVLLYYVNFYFHHPHHLSVELVQGSLLFSFVPNHIQMDKSIKHKQWLCHWRSSLYCYSCLLVNIIGKALNTFHVCSSRNYFKSRLLQRP